MINDHCFMFSMQISSFLSPRPGGGGQWTLLKNFVLSHIDAFIFQYFDIACFKLLCTSTLMGERHVFMMEWLTITLEESIWQIFQLRIKMDQSKVAHCTALYFFFSPSLE